MAIVTGPQAGIPIGVFRGRAGQYSSAGNTGVLTAYAGMPPTAGVPLSSITAYEAWLGQNVDYVLDFAIEAPTTWTQFETGVVGTISGTNVPLGNWGTISPRVFCFSVSPCAGASIGSGGATWADEAAGVNDAHWTALGNYLISHGYQNAVLRIAREFNGNWYPWQVTSSGTSSYTNFINGWRHIVTLLRGLSGAHFQFCWNPYLGKGPSGLSDVTLAYPGDSYVDFIGLDVYDAGYPAEGTPFKRSLSSQQSRFASQQSQTNGLSAWTAFAASHSKPLVYPEWGLTLWNAGSGSVNYTGGGDNAYFISSMANNYISNAGFHALWEHPYNGVFDPDNSSRDIPVPISRQVFLNAFGLQTVPDGTIQDIVPMTWVDDQTLINAQNMNTEIRNSYLLVLNPPTCILQTNATQSIPVSSGWTAVTWNIKTVDTEDPAKPMWASTAPTRVTIQTPGWYEITATVGMASTPFSIITTLGIRINGSTIYRLGSTFGPVTTGTHRVNSVATPIKLNALDYIELVTTHTNTAALSTEVVANQPIFMVYRRRGI